MPERREHPYIWTTWLSRLLAGQNSCEWAGWFKAHHRNWVKPPSDFDQAEWMLNHTAALNRQKEEWLQRGCQVRVEGQNSFQLRGQTATLAGKPDLIVIRDDHTLIIDVKTGQEQPWHKVQLMTYLYALPKAFLEFRDARISGEIVYPTHIARVPKGAPPGQFIDSLGSTIRRIAAEQPPKRVPSAQECRFCDITAADCAQRIDQSTDADQPTTDDF